MNAEQFNNETQLYVKNIQKQAETELTQMRQIITERFGEDQLVNVKNKEKNVALFNEVVRIGQEMEKHIADTQQLSVGSESKFQTFEARLYKIEQESANAEMLGSSNNKMLTGISEKTESRLNQLENGLQLLLVSIYIIFFRVTIKIQKKG